jgi:hypothetical protein
LLYEIHDPAAYYTPDVVADFSQVTLTDAGKDRVRVEGGRGRSRPDTLKVTLGYRDGFIGEGQISYAGSRARQRAQLALDIVSERLSISRRQIDELRCDLIGINALHGELGAAHSDPYEVRARVAGRTRTANDAMWIGNEVEALYTNGPAGGAGATRSLREVLAVTSMLLHRDEIAYHLDIQEA